MTLGELAVGIGSIVGGIRVLSNAHRRDREEALGRLELQRQSRIASQLSHVGSIDQRVAKIKQVIATSIRKPEVRELAASIVAQKCGGDWCVPEKDWAAESRAIFDYARKHVRYTRDIAGIDTFQSAPRTLKWGVGDCDDFSILLGSLLGSIGHAPEAVVIQTKDSQDWNHIYLRDPLPPRSPKGYLALDASVAKPAGWEVPDSMVARRKVFALQ